MRTHFTENDLIWIARMDAKYDVKVYRIAPYKGILLVLDDKKELGRKEVFLTYDARFGPDMADVEIFQREGARIVDERHEQNI